jgi:hypothetical protein
MPEPRDSVPRLFRATDYWILAAALISLALSIYLWFTGHRDEGLFIGLWVPTILAFAIFVKLELPRR